MRYLLFILLCINLTSCYFYDIHFMQYYNTEKCIRRTALDPYNSNTKEFINLYTKKVYNCCIKYSYKELDCKYIYTISKTAIIEYLNYNYN